MPACLPLHPAFVTLQFPLFPQKRQVFFLACGVNMRLQRFSLHSKFRSVTCGISLFHRRKFGDNHVSYIRRKQSKLCADRKTASVSI